MRRVHLKVTSQSCFRGALRKILGTRQAPRTANRHPRMDTTVAALSFSCEQGAGVHSVGCYAFYTAANARSRQPRDRHKASFRHVSRHSVYSVLPHYRRQHPAARVVGLVGVGTAIVEAQTSDEVVLIVTLVWLWITKMPKQRKREITALDYNTLLIELYIKYMALVRYSGWPATLPAINNVAHTFATS